MSTLLLKARKASIVPLISRRYASFSLKSKKRTLAVPTKKPKSIHPITPARTRFAPSPTGYLHMGSLRTALYNYLLAKNTGGQFLLRLEDTDQKRLVHDAEQDIYESLNWCGLNFDEGPVVGGPYGPYRQSDRKEIYLKYADQLVKNGSAYYCFCPKERLDGLRDSAKRLQPPTSVSYDRRCSHNSQEEVKTHLENGDEFTIRFKSPETYPEFEDLLHGKLSLQPQYNHNDRRYDDFIILKSDGLPTYHFANVVDDHLMKITHVIRGEEWLASTPKHIALYNSFGWESPRFIHIPLLTTVGDKKLSKRSGDIGVLSMKKRGILPEALTNFSALFGWSPPRLVQGVSSKEVHDLKELEKLFSLDDLTKGNAKVDDKKLNYFNKIYLSQRINDPEKLHELEEQWYPEFVQLYPSLSNSSFSNILKQVGPSVTTMAELKTEHSYLFQKPDFTGEEAVTYLNSVNKDEAKSILALIEASDLVDSKTISNRVDNISQNGYNKKAVYHVIRFALSGGIPGLNIPSLISVLGIEEANQRIKDAIIVLV